MGAATAMKTIPVARPSFGSEEEGLLLAALRSGWVSQGPRVAEFERQFAQFVGAPYAVAVSSCTAALHLSLIAAGVKPDDEVICPSLSFIATANAIVHAGAWPVFADVDESTYNVTAESIEAAITPAAKAILLVHQIGLPAPVEEIAAVAARHGLIVVEDAACAIGSEYRGRRVGMPHTMMASFSFHPRKILTTGEGGMITTADESVAVRLRRLRQHAMSVSDLTRHSSAKVVSEVYDEIGFNYRMTDLQAAVGLAQLERLPDMLARRRRLAARYSSQLSSFPWLALPVEPPGCVGNFQSYMVRLCDDAPLTRDDLMQQLLDRGVSTRRGVMAIHREAPYQSGLWESTLPVTNRLVDTGLILPLYHDMTEAEQDYVISCMEAICTEAAK